MLNTSRCFGATQNAGCPSAPRLSKWIARPRFESSERQGRHRWVMGRTLARLKRFRRLTMRYECRADLHQAFQSLGGALVC
jgi:hypothetical protein